MNALADILGAYWQKQDELGALKDINNINFPDPNQGQQTLSQAAQNYMYGAPNSQTSGDTGMSLADSIALGKSYQNPSLTSQAIGNSTDASQIGNSNSIMGAAQNYSQPTQAQLAAIAPAPASEIPSNGNNAALQKSYNDYKAAEEANPQWYVGDTYVGDDANAKQAALQAQAQQQSEANGISNTVQNMTPDAIGNQSALTTADQDSNNAALQKSYNDYKAAEEANPEWYVGDTYVGTDKKAKQAALQAQAQKQAQDVATQFSDANQSISDNLNTYEQYASQVTQMEANIMYKVAQKYGVDALQTIEPLIDKTIQGKLSGLAQSLDLQNRNVLMPLLDYAGTQTGNLRALESMVNYNNAAKQMGLTGIDQNDANNLINSFANNISKVDTGGDVKFVATPKNGIAYDTGQLLTTAGTLQKSITPDTDAKLKVDVWKWINPSGNQKLASQTQLQVTQMNNSAKTYIAQMQNAIEQGKLSVENKNSVIASCKEIVNAAGVDAGTKQGALNVLKTVGGVPDPAGWIDEAKNRGYSHDQIISKLHQQGYGDSYDSWVPDD